MAKSEIQWTDYTWNPVTGCTNQCKQANVPVFVKQIQVNGKVIKDINQFPDHLQVRQYPTKNFAVELNKNKQS